MLSDAAREITRPSGERTPTVAAMRLVKGLFIASDEASSKLHFENPNPLIGFIEAAQPTEFNMEMAKFKLAPGDLVLFPSWLKHGSGFEANQSALRIMISLNAGA